LTDLIWRFGVFGVVNNMKTSRPIISQKNNPSSFIIFTKTSYMKALLLYTSAWLFLAIGIVSCVNVAEIKYNEPVLFNNDWSFRMEADSLYPTVDTSWTSVLLPHTPRIEPLIVNDQWQGICWYRKTFTLPADFKGKALSLKFEGAMNVADVWVNGKKISHHLGGFLPFVVDITSVAKFNEENTVEVRLDNRDNPITGPKPLLQLDFNTYGGLYRNVYLLVKNPLHISDPIGAGIEAGGGVFVTYPAVSHDKATIQVKTHVINRGGTIRSFVVQQRLMKDGNIVLTSNSPRVDLDPNNDQEVSMTFELRNPLLWSPRTPNLYDLVTEIIADDGIEDALITRIGIRRFEITREHFRINGKAMFLRGVNRHQEYPYIGYALSDEAQYRDARKIKEAGFDYVRLSHYPMSPAFMDACDELGLLVLDAIPGWQYFNEDIRFQEYSWQTCRDLIRRDRNHACVFAWEVSLNESWMPEAYIDKATAIAHAEYPGDQCFTAGWQKYGYDIYLQARQHRLQHYETPDKPYIVSEYGDWEYYAMNAGLKQDQWGDLLQEERSSRQLLGSGEKRLLQQVSNIQEAHNDNFNTPAFADGYWVMYDYNRGYANDLEASGIMSIHRLPKFSYYFYRSQRDPDDVSNLFSSGPMVFIASYWTPDSDRNIRVFSNCDEVELYLNHTLIERRTPDEDRISNHLNHPPFAFHLENFEAGTLRAIGFVNGKEVATHSLSTPGEPAQLALSWDESGKIPVAGVKDAIFVYAYVQDENGNIVRENGRIVQFMIAGSAYVVNPAPVETEAGMAAALVMIGDHAGDIQVEVKSTGLQSVATTIPVVDTQNSIIAP
jgi:beta-galactosidase